MNNPRIPKEFHEKYSGEAKSLKNLSKMGDLSSKTKIPENIKNNLKEKFENKKFSENKIENNFYKPITNESKNAYIIFLDIISKLMPDMPEDFLLDTCEEILSILKLKNKSKLEKEKDINFIVKLKKNVFNKLFELSNEITDFYKMEDNSEKNEITNLKIEEEEEEKKNVILGNIEEINNLEIEEIEDFKKEEEDLINEDFEKFENKDYLISLIKRNIFDDFKARELEQDILQILGIEDEIESQNRLMEIGENLDFDIVKQIFDERYFIYYGFYLKINQGNDDKIKEIISQIIQDEKLHKILSPLLKKYESDNIIKNIYNEKNKDFWKKLNNSELNLIPKKIIIKNKKSPGFLSFSKETLKLPKNSKKIKQEGYDEIIIPSFQKNKREENLIKIKNLPEWCNSIFPDIKELNPIQTKTFQYAFKSSKNMLVSAPTGAGKTIIALMTILGLFEKNKNIQNEINFKKIKIIYIAPMKALVSEIVATFKKRLNYLGVNICEFTGDVHLTSSEFMKNCLIVTTPEKWDVVSRKASEKILIDSIKLVIIDEVHLLGDVRGPVIEGNVIRILEWAENFGKDIRILGLSATLPNYKEVAKFLKVDKEGVFYFGNEYRPIPLEQNYIGVSEKKGFKKMMLIKEILYKKVIERVKTEQILIFVHSRKETFQTANYLQERAFSEDLLSLFLEPNSNSEKIITSLLPELENNNLKEIIKSGIGIHHAGLSRKDRFLMEDLFANKNLSVLISTATLAWGVNLPARTVIIKNTQVYSPELGKWTELNIQDVLQMLGRAGRPGFDREGLGIILTGLNQVRKYLGLLNEQMPIESFFLEKILDQLNAAIVSDSVLNFKDALNWLDKSYFVIRLRKNPEYYGLIIKDEKNKNIEIFHFLLNLVYTCINDLEKYGMITFNKKNGVFEKTYIGIICSYFYIKPTSMQIYNSKISEMENTIDIFNLFTLSEEFKYIIIREEEKIEIQKLINSVPIPVKTTLDDPLSKINVLLQCYISKINLEGYSINADMVYISQNAQRIFRALFNLSLKKKLGNCWKFLEICIMVEKRCWNCLSPLRQFFKIDSKIIRKIEQQEHLTWEHFLYMTQNQINNIIKNEEDSRIVFNSIKIFPRFEYNLSAQPISRNLIEIEILIKKNFDWDYNIHGNSQFLWILVLDCDQENLIYYQPIIFYKDNYEKTFKFKIFIEEPYSPNYFVKVMNDQWLKSSITLPLSFMDIIPVAKFPFPTDLSENIDLEPSLVFLKKYSQILEIEKFNAIQHEVFSSFYDTFENIFLGALEGSDKLKIAYSSIIRLYEEDKEKNSKTVILFPYYINQSEIKILKNISDLFNLKQTILEGDLQEDIKKLKNNNIIISTVKNFDKLSRNYKKRENLKEIRLLICNDIHFVNKKKMNYEVLLSKLKLYYNLIDKKVRFLILSRPISNFDSICDWLQIKPEFAYNFPPSLRKNDIDIIFLGFEKINPKELLLNMTQKIFSLIKLNNFENKKIVIVTENRQNARIVISRLLKNLLSSKKNLVEENDYKKILKETSKTLSDVYLSNFIQFGAAYIFESLLELEKKTILELFLINAIKILVIPKSEISIFENLKTDILIILDTNNLEILKISETMKSINYEDNSENKKLIIMTQEWKKEEIKENLFQNFSLESNLNKNLINILNKEIASNIISNKQECIDYLTWTFFYRRLIKNPNFYYLNSIDSEKFNEYLSEFINSVLEDLKSIGFLEIENDNSFDVLNPGIISAFYDVDVLTVYNFFLEVKKNLDFRDIIKIFSEQKDFEQFEIENSEVKENLKKLYTDINFKNEEINFWNFSFKIFVLIQAYLSRLSLNKDFEIDLKKILKTFLELLQVFIDCSSAENELKNSLLCMKLSQMLTQKMWNNDHQLLQLPYFNKKTILKAEKMNINDLDDFFELENEEREILLSEFSEREINKIAEFANRVPSVNIKFEFPDKKNYEEGEKISFEIFIERENLEIDEKLTKVKNNGFFYNKKENWWLLISDKKKNCVLHIRRIYFEKDYRKKISFLAAKVGEFDLSIMLVCDSYLGCDIENKGPVIFIKESSEEEESEEEDDDDN